MLVVNYDTKKELKKNIGKPLKYTETSLFGPEYSPGGTFCVVGPSAYNRKWYAEVTMKQGLIDKIS